MHLYMQASTVCMCGGKMHVQSRAKVQQIYSFHMGMVDVHLNPFLNLDQSSTVSM